LNSQEFRHYWLKQYGGCPPISNYLRDALSDRWFRIHTLPESKRYANTEAEYQQIIERHNTLLLDLLGDNRPFVLITTGYSETNEPVRPEAEAKGLVSESEWFLSIAMHKLEDEVNAPPRYWHFFMCEAVWRPGSKDRLLRMVADWELANILIVGVEQGCIYHPYDGGADIILSSERERDIKKKKYASWLSSHPSGL
jgi:hypothetical protein